MAKKKKKQINYLYKYYNVNIDRPLYVGITISPSNRVKQHAVSSMWSPLWDMYVIKPTVLDRKECNKKESNLIIKEQPLFNLLDNEANKLRIDYRSDKEQSSDLDWFTYTISAYDNTKTMVNIGSADIDVDFCMINHMLNETGYGTLILKRFPKPEFASLITANRLRARKELIYLHASHKVSDRALQGIS